MENGSPLGALSLRRLRLADAAGLVAAVDQRLSCAAIVLLVGFLCALGGGAVGPPGVIYLLLILRGIPIGIR